MGNQEVEIPRVKNLAIKERKQKVWLEGKMN